MDEKKELTRGEQLRRALSLIHIYGCGAAGNVTLKAP